MTAEALDLILRIWTSEEPFEHKGEFWNVTFNPEIQFGQLRQWLKPYQKPHPPIGVAGLSSPSPTLEMAGERGFFPMSLNLNPSYVATHWDSVVTGANRTGRIADRKDWRIVREVFIADTDAEAMRWSVGSHMGRMMDEYLLPLLCQFGFGEHLKHDKSLPDSVVNAKYMAETAWLVGSPETVAEKLEEQYELLGGFGTMLVLCFDYSTDPEPWRQSMERLAKEVMPKVAHLQTKAPDLVTG